VSTRPSRGRAGTFGVLAAGLVALLGLALVQGKPEPADDPEAVAAGAVRAQRGTVVRSVTFQGRIGGGRQLALVSEFDAPVAQVHVAYGAAVTAGQVLVVFDPGEVERQIERQRAQQKADALWLRDYFPVALNSERLAQAKLEAQVQKAAAEARARVGALERGVAQNIATAEELALARRAADDQQRDAQALLADGQLKLQRLEQQRLERENTQRATASGLKALEQQARRYQLTAPFAGIVTGFNEVLASGRAVPLRRETYLLTLSEAGSRVVETSIAPTDLHYFATHREMDCRVRKSGVRARCTVNGVQKAPEGLQYLVRLDLDGTPATLELGEAVSITSVIESREAAVTLPLGALQVLDGDRIGVLQREGKALRFVPVDVGLRGDDSVEIVKGLKVGDVVQLAPDGPRK
jgi:HlyD family secretion protein